MDRAASPNEPRSLTVLDLIALTAGAAVGASLRGWPVPRIGPVLKIYDAAEAVIAWSAVAVGAAVLVRQARFGRAAWPREWGVLPGCAATIAAALPVPIAHTDDVRRAGWVAAGAIAAGILALIALRGALPRWGRSLAVALLAAAFLRWPVHAAIVTALEWNNPWWSGLTRGGWWFWAWYVAVLWVPDRLLLPIPAVAAARDTGAGDGRRVWTERAAAAMLYGQLLLSLVDLLVLIDGYDAGSRARRGVVLLTATVALALAAHGLILALGPAWGRLMGGTPGLEPHPRRPDESERVAR